MPIVTEVPGVVKYDGLAAYKKLTVTVDQEAEGAALAQQLAMRAAMPVPEP